MAKDSSKTYQQLADELTEIFEWFESSKVNLDEALPKYERAQELLSQMEKILKTAENKVIKINANFNQGND